MIVFLHISGVCPYFPKYYTTSFFCVQPFCLDVIAKIGGHKILQALVFALTGGNFQIIHPGETLAAGDAHMEFVGQILGTENGSASVQGDDQLLVQHLELL